MPYSLISLVNFYIYIYKYQPTKKTLENKYQAVCFNTIMFLHSLCLYKVQVSPPPPSPPVVGYSQLGYVLPWRYQSTIHCICCISGKTKQGCTLFKLWYVGTELWIGVFQTELNTLYFYHIFTPSVENDLAPIAAWDFLFHQLCTYWTKNHLLHLETGFSKVCIINEDHQQWNYQSCDIIWMSNETPVRNTVEFYRPPKVVPPQK